MIYSLNTSCSFQSPWLIQSFTCLLRWAPVGPISVNCAGGICEMRQTRLQTQKTGLKLWRFVFLWASCFVLILSTFFQIRNRPLGAGSSKQRWFGLYFFWRNPGWGGTGRIPGLVPAVPPRKNWPLDLCGVESIELPWEAKHNTG